MYRRLVQPYSGLEIQNTERAEIARSVLFLSTTHSHEPPGCLGLCLVAALITVLRMWEVERPSAKCFNLCG